MTVEVGFSVDLISDLNVTKSQSFEWTGKPTSLFCIIAGNISDDLDTVKYVLEHLSSMYRGIFYIDGPLEHPIIQNFNETVTSLGQICQQIPNAIYMHNHVVVLNSIAFVAVNGWYKNNAYIQDFEDRNMCESLQKEDLGYLSQTLRNLQKHKDISKIIVISSSIPSDHLNFKYNDNIKYTVYEPSLSLIMDTDSKVTHWFYSGTNIVTDRTFNKRRYVNNPNITNQPYWPKRIVL